ncbi:hypothetical protein ABB37_08943 [Leptomonas pyrrhocoris]|uniref:Reverse transcriptase domain-containing protein n=1 Tax=Leptomonas pyrrhocoris TaxID=157538 RepID=A0A0M9FS89_LEPPY|nr:hypothetical protein ABB37_08943 [Leptomonas pyrrhocoris]XP_015653421.1 hypothetical protein ABB37_08943 [Leptomonas pyrrhocoris]XP_015653422.1 hypothetical protein ABB37_08943 [Leptomonas pyrrhocoris]KPA74981.1 hypothetical protein ABB37_08943 [Leptomonas pyrrhocoris]KPA74982.1 hypothetical protein ABB37_08943 [Leptomonas pyrrhocoris]KPA74983.1 hypothetical protein ABB37_08943 [Leptomonas pyrrhocoris]|eukprot:XP_015653420.1 hypothetical protein ABB37_08943 [Leptomonas pyrrhocoris]
MAGKNSRGRSVGGKKKVQSPSGRTFSKSPKKTGGKKEVQSPPGRTFSKSPKKTTKEPNTRNIGPSKTEEKSQMPQFDQLAAQYATAAVLDKAIAEHTELAGRLMERHASILQRHYAWANPVHQAYFYCTAVDVTGAACTFASDAEEDVQKHIRERHPGSGAVPRRFGLSRYTGGMANIGPSCSVTAVVAALATVTGGYQQNDILRKAFRTSSAEDSRAFLQALNLRLPNSPAAVLGALAARDAATDAFFGATECHDTFCKTCGTTIEGPRVKSSGVLTYTAPPGSPQGGTAKALENAFGPEATDAVQYCSVCGCDAQPCVNMVHYLFHNAVAVTVVPPPTQPNNRGLPEIPLEVGFATRPLAATPFILHAALCVTTPTHLVAYVAERVEETTYWHLYDGTVHTKGVKAPDAAKVRMLLYLPVPIRHDVGEGDNEDEEHSNGRPAGAPPPPPPPPPPPTSLGTDEYGHELFGIVLPEGSADTVPDDEDEAEEDQPTAPSPHPLPNHPLTIPDTPPARRAEEDGEDGTSSDDIELVQPEGQFLHGDNVHIAPAEGLSCPFCAHRWTSAARRAQQTDHANHTHGQERCGAEALKRAGLDRCLVCGQFVVASRRGRAAHLPKCGPYETRAVRNSKRARQDPATPVEGEDDVADTPPTVAPQQRRREPPTEEDLEWVKTCPPTIRTLRKQEWGVWCEAVGQTLLGYTAATQQERHRRQIAMTTLVRTRLAKPQPEGAEEAPRSGTEGVAAGDDQRQRNTEEELPTTRQLTPEEKRNKRILHQISLGALGKAARTLFHAQLPRARVSDVVEQLQELHPQEDPAGHPMPPQVPFMHGLKPEKVSRAIVQRLGRASAPGLDGWTRELLIPVAENKNLLQEFTTLLQDILSGRVSPSFAFRLRACVLHPFLKEAGSPKVRPITPESAILKIASHVALDAVPKSFREVFRGWQFGVWGDAAAAVKQIRAAYASASADTLVALDATNAYNRMSRAHILSAFYSHEELRPAFGVVDIALGEPGALGVYEHGRRTQELASTRGVRQGMVLGPLLFATAMEEVLRPLIASHKTVKVTAYLDDLTVVGPRRDVQLFLDAAGPLLSNVGFDINPAKSHHLSKMVAPVPVTVAGTVVPVATDVVRILGAGLQGNSAPVEEWVWDKTQKYESYFAALEDDKLPRHSRLNLLRASALPRLTFLLRTHCPQELERSATWFDQRVLRVLSALVGDAAPDNTAHLIAKLPMVMGGLGLRSQTAISKFAAASVGRKSAQRDQTRVVDKEVRETLLPLLSEPCLALLKANAAPGATRALVDPAVHLPDSAFEVMIRQRLMLRVLRPGVCCACGADADNAHVNVCPALPGGPRISRHNRVVMAIDAWAKQLGLSTVVEPRVGTANRERLDLTIATAGETFATDVVVTYPGRSCGDAQSPLQQSHGEKKRKWANWAHESGTVFAPVSLESTGGLHKESFAWMLAVAGSMPFPYSARTALSELLSAVCQAVHEGNSFQFAAVKNVWARSLQRRVD